VVDLTAVMNVWIRARSSIRGTALVLG